jgi:hypothetical protein
MNRLFSHRVRLVRPLAVGPPQDQVRLVPERLIQVADAIAIFCGTWTGLQAPSLNVPGFAGEVSISIPTCNAVLTLSRQVCQSVSA